MWVFFCYDERGKISLWQAWYDSCDDATKASHDYALEFLEVREHHDWIGTPHFGPLVPQKGIYEIRLPGKIKWRLLGYFGPRPAQFTVVLICNHKGPVYEPKDSRKTAVKRKGDIESGKRKRIHCVRPGKN